MKKSLKLTILFLILVLLMQIPVMAFADEEPAPDTEEPTFEVGFVTKEDGNTYYVDENGEYVKGFITLNKKDIYYFDSKTGILQTGAFTVDGNSYLADKNSGRLHKGWYEKDGYKYYYAQSTGRMLKGWQTIGGYKYYFSKDNGRMFKGWHTIGSYKYYFSQSTGRILKGWNTIGGYKYYFDKDNGRMFKGWHTIGSYEYYFSQSTGRILKGWNTIGDYKYYFNKDNGRMFKGWHTIGDYRYYFGKSTGRMYKGLHKLGDNVYTFNDKGRLIRTVYADKKSVCLTYDDGPSDNTATILKTLKSNGALATFFVVGERVSWYPDAMADMASMGCQIGNHSYTHPYYSNLSSGEIKSQISKCNSAVKEYAGVAPTVCRTPGGGSSSTINSSVGMPIIFWSVDTLDWSSRNADSVYSKVMSGVKDGSVILMHDLYASTAQASQRIIPELKSEGYQMVTIQEMALLKGVTLKNGTVYSSF